MRKINKLPKRKTVKAAVQRNTRETLLFSSLQTVARILLLLFGANKKEHEDYETVTSQMEDGSTAYQPFTGDVHFPVA